jgi:hypothetical protein
VASRRPADLGDGRDPARAGRFRTAVPLLPQAGGPRLRPVRASFLHLLDTTGLLPPEKVDTPWAGRLVCVWGLVAGRFRVDPARLDREQVHEHLGIDPSGYASHTASDDTQWVKDVYDAVVPT